MTVDPVTDGMVGDHLVAVRPGDKDPVDHQTEANPPEPGAVPVPGPDDVRVFRPDGRLGEGKRGGWHADHALHRRDERCAAVVDSQPHVQKWMEVSGCVFCPHTTSINKRDPKYGLESIGDLFRQGQIRIPRGTLSANEWFQCTQNHYLIESIQEVNDVPRI